MATSPLPALLPLPAKRPPSLTEEGKEHYGNMGNSAFHKKGGVPDWMADNTGAINKYATDDAYQLNPETHKFDGISWQDRLLNPNIDAQVWSARRTLNKQYDRNNSPQVEIQGETGSLHDLGRKYGVDPSGNMDNAQYQTAVRGAAARDVAGGLKIDLIDPNTGNMKGTRQLETEIGNEQKRAGAQQEVEVADILGSSNQGRLKSSLLTSQINSADAQTKSSNAGIAHNQALLNLKIDGLEQEAIQAAEARNQQISLAQLQNDANYRVAALQNAENARQHDAEMAWHTDREKDESWNKIIEMITLGAMSMA